MVHLPHVVPNPSLLRSNQTRYSEHERKLNPLPMELQSIAVSNSFSGAKVQRISISSKQRGIKKQNGKILIHSRTQTN